MASKRQKRQEEEKGDGGGAEDELASDPLYRAATQIPIASFDAPRTEDGWYHRHGLISPKEELLEKSALRIQAIFRGRKAYRATAGLRRQRAETVRVAAELNQRNESAAKIQKWMRGAVVRMQIERANDEPIIFPDPQPDTEDVDPHQSLHKEGRGAETPLRQSVDSLTVEKTRPRQRTHSPSVAMAPADDGRGVSGGGDLTEVSVVKEEGAMEETDILGFGLPKKRLQFGGGAKFVGEVVAVTKRQAHGKGKILYPDGSIYSGEFVNNKRHGRGFLFGADGTRYVGDWYEDEKHGEGKEVRVDGSVYIGQFRSGLRHGKGALTWKDGNVYQGDFKDGSAEGFGRFVFKDGKIYEGQHLNGEMHGLGVMKWPDGTEYLGIFQSNRRTGKGRMTWPDGSLYEGGWKDGRQHGQGLFKSTKDGSVKHGMFINGRCVRVLPASVTNPAQRGKRWARGDASKRLAKSTSRLSDGQGDLTGNKE
ncbi:unnamed protein product [Vitrella brassicaformis CCMP3155]|uniref:Uncharacterized protein n=3 Tax=Vitrella brassicaformis TaxID=1169539 RepID=A0A0G4EGI9_VITBC|nr:unnamed protein product [Vitrella brassicaformis CCMP3155]|eukprot:CEL94544.1 unnamed protein product [Vitrella brassicaformis CCMP3155]